MPIVLASSKTSITSAGVAPWPSAFSMCWRSPGTYMWVADASKAV